jgi:hypothetical protein
VHARRARFGVVAFVYPHSQKYFRFTDDPNHRHVPVRLVPQEGRIAIVTDAGRDAVDADVLLTSGTEADGEVVWSRRLDAGAKSCG